MAPFQKWSVTEPYLDLHCSLGEGPYYEESNNRLRFVDIKKKQLHTVDLTSGPGSLHTLQLDMPVGVTADIEGVDSRKKILVGGKSGIYMLDRETGHCELLKKFHDTEEKDERLRSNDGAVDPQGRFWLGIMNDFWVGEPQAEGESEHHLFFPWSWIRHFSLGDWKGWREGGELSRLRVRHRSYLIKPIHKAHASARDDIEPSVNSAHTVMLRFLRFHLPFRARSEPDPDPLLSDHS